MNIFRYDGTAWISMQTLTDPNYPSSDNTYFGYTVSISENYLMVSRPLSDVGSVLDQGTVMIYQRIGLAWQSLLNVIDPGGYSDNRFGFSAAVDATSKRFVIGVAHYGNNSGKVVFGKIN